VSEPKPKSRPKNTNTRYFNLSVTLYCSDDFLYSVTYMRMTGIHLSDYLFMFVPSIQLVILIGLFWVNLNAYLNRRAKTEQMDCRQSYLHTDILVFIMGVSSTDKRTCTRI